MKYDDYIMNRNVELTLVNMRYVKEITPFNENEINSVQFGVNDYMYGTKSVLWLDYVNAIHVIDTIEEIHNKLSNNRTFY
jgi:hypothetical protein